MAQHDYDIANASSASVRADINNALSAIVSTNSGATAPSSTFANMLWYDSANDILKMRNEADDGWINLLTLDQTADTALPSTEQSVACDLLQSVDASTLTVGSLTSFNNSLYNSYEIRVHSAVPTDTVDTDHILRMRSSSNAGSTYDSGSTDYAYYAKGISFQSTPVEYLIGSGGADTINITANTLGTFYLDGQAVAESKQGFSGTMTINGATINKNTMFEWRGAGENVSEKAALSGTAYRLEDNSVNAVQFYFNTGTTFESGTFELYGYRKS